VQLADIKLLHNIASQNDSQRLTGPAAFYPEIAGIPACITTGDKLIGQ